jgi:hypothetical protein
LKVYRVSIQVILQQVASRDQFWGKGTREKETIGVEIMARADVSKRIDYAVVCEDTIGRYQVLDQPPIRRAR